MQFLSDRYDCSTDAGPAARFNTPLGCKDNDGGTIKISNSETKTTTPPETPGWEPV